MKRPNVHLTGGEGIGWALDEDLKLTRQAMEGFVNFVDLKHADTVHCIWWNALLNLPSGALSGKRVICHVSGEPFRMMTLPEHNHVMPLVDLWITRTSQARDQLLSMGHRSVMIPYLVDTAVFRPMPADEKHTQEIPGAAKLPSDAYRIGSFQRDSEGSDLQRPKLVKGPDVLLEIVRELRQRGRNVHLLIAGPRRHWLMSRLTEHGIPFTYLGTEIPGDDIERNRLPRSVLNTLYGLTDLCVVSSRSEGGPHAILEAAAARCKIVSTPVGMARDVLEPECVFSSPADAVEIIEKDILEGFLDRSIEPHYRRVLETHTAERAARLFRELYENPDQARFTSRGTDRVQIRASGSEALGPPPARVRARSSPPGLTIGLWHTFFNPPYGGGNQFMMALRKALLKRSIEVRENVLEDGIDAYVLNSIHFDVDRFVDFRRTHRVNVVHRIDGPIHLIRGFDREKDELCFRLNDRFAAATVVQSAWTYQRIVEMGHQLRNPVIIHNAVDSELFNREGRVPLHRDRKIRLISTSWSNNPRKGGPIYTWLDKNLDWGRFEYTFVGNVSEDLTRIRHVPPVASTDLARILKEHDIYITASKNDPCSNAVIEGLSCGLPTLYLDSGGHAELVGYGGLPFQSTEELLTQLETLVEHYEMFQNLISVPSLDAVAEKYLALAREAAQ